MAIFLSFDGSAAAGLIIVAPYPALFDHADFHNLGVLMMTAAPAFNMDDYQSRFLSAIRLGEDGKEQRAELAQELFRQYLKTPDIYIGSVLQVCSYISRTDGLPESKEDSYYFKLAENESTRSSEAQKSDSCEAWERGARSIFKTMKDDVLFEAEKPTPDYRRIGATLESVLYVDFETLPTGMQTILGEVSEGVAIPLGRKLKDSMHPGGSLAIMRVELPFTALSSIFEAGAGNRVLEANIPFDREHLEFWQFPETAALAALSYADKYEDGRKNFDFKNFDKLLRNMNRPLCWTTYKEVFQETERKKLDQMFEMTERARGHLMNVSPRGAAENQRSPNQWEYFANAYFSLGGMESYADEKHPDRIDYITTVGAWCHKGTTNEPPATAYSFAQILNGMTAALKLPNGTQPQPASRANGSKPSP